MSEKLGLFEESVLNGTSDNKLNIGIITTNIWHCSDVTVSGLDRGTAQALDGMNTFVDSVCQTSDVLFGVPQ